MDVIDGQRTCLNALLNSVFQTWEGQLNAKVEECNSLRSSLGNLSEEISGLKSQVAEVERLRQENEQLQEQLERLRKQDPSTDYSDGHQDVVAKYTKLLQEDEIKQAKIEVLQSQLRKDRKKLRQYVQYTYSSSPAHLTLPQNEHPNQLGRSALAVDISPFQGRGSNELRLEPSLPTTEETPRERRVVGCTLPEEDTPNSPTSDTPRAGNSIDPAQNPSIAQASGNQEQYSSDQSLFQDLNLSPQEKKSSPQLPPRARPRGLLNSTAPMSNGLSAPPVDEASSSTAPPSEELSIVDTPDFEDNDPASSDDPEVLGARSIPRPGTQAKSGIDICGHEVAAVGTIDEPVLVKSESSPSFADTVSDYRGGISFRTENLDSVPRRTSPSKVRPPGLVSSNSSGPMIQMAVDQLLAHRSDRAISEPADISVPKTTRPASRTNSNRRHAALAEVDVNNRVLPRTSDNLGHVSKKRKSDTTRGAHAIPTIAEDGENQVRHSRSSKGDPARNSSPGSVSVHHRLVDLLTDPSPSRAVLLQPASTIQNVQGVRRSDNLSRQARPSEVATTHIMKEESNSVSPRGSGSSVPSSDAKDSSQELDTNVAVISKKRGSDMKVEECRKTEQAPIIDAERRKTADKFLGSRRPLRPEWGSEATPQRSSAATSVPNMKNKSSAFLPQKRTAAPGPEDMEPFRCRPLNRLGLSHFKVNPKSNAGVDYAYTEVIRNQEQRKCLPGCTRAECCGGKFRALALTLPNVRQGKRTSLGTNRARSPDENTRDAEILKSFLGTGSESKIATLTSIARENLLIEAKTKIAADKYGKMHRFAHERAKTPPGFWRTEMPGTQEEEEDRERVRVRERDEVEKRYKEACREGGRWVFADE